MQTKTETIPSPTAPAELTIKELHEILSRPIPSHQVKIKPGRAKAKYIPWEFAQSVINKYCLGYEWRIKAIQQISDRAVITGQLIIPCKDGNLTIESTGSSSLQGESYADPICVAEQMAFKRCCKRLGLALNLEE